MRDIILKHPTTDITSCPQRQEYWQHAYSNTTHSYQSLTKYTMQQMGVNQTQQNYPPYYSPF